MIKLLKLKVIAIVLPVLVISAWIGSYVYRANIGAEIELPVYGYDPRDLLAGHYLQYRVEYGGQLECQGHTERCVCLHKVGAHFAAQASLDCNAAFDSCEHVLRGKCVGSQFIAGIERYYFPEQFTKELRTVPDDATIKLRLSKDGKGVVTGFYITGKPLTDWLKEQPPQ